MLRALGLATVVIGYFMSMPGLAEAQGNGAIELGFDGGVTYFVGPGDDVLSVDLPIQSIRAGWYASDKVELETSFRLHLSERDLNITDSFDLGAGLLVHFGDTPKRAPFLMARFTYRRLDLGIPGAAEAFTLAFGYKLPVADHWGVRLQFDATRLEQGSFAEEVWELGPRFGISAFTK